MEVSEGEISSTVKNLVIVESPAKAKTLEAYLGEGYRVEASVGHVRDLPRSGLGVDVESGFEPEYVTIDGKGQILKKLKSAAKEAETVLLATDPDREGEAIAFHIATRPCSAGSLPNRQGSGCSASR